MTDAQKLAAILSGALLIFGWLAFAENPTRANFEVAAARTLPFL
jgi:hypothetical protein